eukprot:PITA_19780
MGKCVVTKPYSYKEAVQQTVWVDAMVEEYDAIIHNSVWDVVPRPEDKSVVSSRWMYKQTPHAWYTRIDIYFTVLGFAKSEADENLYHIVMEGKMLIIVLYVDYLILTCDDQLIESCKEDLAREFEMKYMETPLAGKWRMEDATSREVVEAIVYGHIVGSLMYLVNT